MIMMIFPDQMIQAVSFLVTVPVHNFKAGHNI